MLADFAAVGSRQAQDVTRPRVREAARLFYSQWQGFVDDLGPAVDEYQHAKSTGRPRDLSRIERISENVHGAIDALLDAIDLDAIEQLKEMPMSNGHKYQSTVNYNNTVNGGPANIANGSQDFSQSINGATRDELKAFAEELLSGLPRIQDPALRDELRTAAQDLRDEAVGEGRSGIFREIWTKGLGALVVAAGSDLGSDIVERGEHLAHAIGM